MSSLSQSNVRINATFVENKCNFLTFLLQQKLALLIIKHLRPRISFTILKNNDFMCLKTDIFKFLDIKNYIAPGFSYKKFIKACGASQSKFYFPYEWFDSLEKLKHDKLPPYETFYSSLKKKHISAEKYQLSSRCGRNVVENQCETCRCTTTILM